MSTSQKNVVIMFADIVGSTSLYEQVGDAEAQRIVAATLNVVRNVAESHHGEVKAELGDESMLIFDDPGDAAASACDIHARVADRLGFEDTTVSIRMRIGMHCGPIEGDDYLSQETGKIAHWAADNAKAEQTLATEVVVQRLPRIFQAVSRYVDDETWNFVSLEHVTLHEIIWDVESVTAFAGEQPTLDTQKCRQVEFTYGETTIVLSPDRPVISAGRGKQNDLILDTDLASRQHFSAQISRGRSTITDNSTNGTQIYDDDGTKQSLKNETLPLNGSGKIVVGRPAKAEPRFIVHYRCS